MFDRVDFHSFQKVVKEKGEIKNLFEGVVTSCTKTWKYFTQGEVDGIKVLCLLLSVMNWFIVALKFRFPRLMHIKFLL